MFETLHLPNFVIKIFLEEKLLAIKFNISNIGPLSPPAINIQKSTAIIGLTITLFDGK